MEYPNYLYEHMFFLKTGAKLTKEESDFLNTFANSYTMSQSKIIYYFTLYYMKRYVPLFVIRFIISRKVCKVFKNENAPMSFQKLYKEFAEIIVFTAMKQFSLGKAKSNKCLDNMLYRISKQKSKKSEPSAKDSLSFHTVFEKYMALFRK